MDDFFWFFPPPKKLFLSFLVFKQPMNHDFEAGLLGVFLKMVSIWCLQ